MKERRKRNMSRTGLLFMFCLLMLCGCAQITGFMENTEVSGREVESLAAEPPQDFIRTADGLFSPHICQDFLKDRQESRAWPPVIETGETFCGKAPDLKGGR